MDKAIDDFLAERKTNRLKKKISPSLSLEASQAIQEETEAMFTLEQWLPSAAKRAAQISLVSHPSKFSHPSAKATPVVAHSHYQADGYLRTGNVKSGLDAFGNAAAMDVYKFLMLTFSDGKSILRHLEENTQKIRENLSVQSENYDEIRGQFLAIKKTNLPVESYTSDKIKQVFFPVDKSYHLLSILTPSSLVYEMKARIQEMHFSAAAKEARDLKRKNKFSDFGFDEIYGLTTVGYGGTKPQNISVLNSANGGKAYMLPSLPPIINTSRQRLPKNDFFFEIIWLKEAKIYFEEIHRLIISAPNNEAIRRGIDNKIQAIVDFVLKKVWSIRLHGAGWSFEKRYSNLPLEQKMWLDDARIEDRFSNNEWFEKIADQFARWYVRTYNKIIKDAFGKEELDRFKSILLDNKENLL